MNITIISAGALSMLILQFIVKPLLRKFWLGEQYDFSPRLYVLMVTVMNIITALPLAILKIEGYYLPTNWVEWLRDAAVIAIQALITFASYELTVKPMREYSNSLPQTTEKSELRGR